MKCSYITPIHRQTVDVILELRTCTRIDAHVSAGTLDMREMCP